MSAVKEIAVAVLPVLATQVREAMTAKREADKCEHGRPGGRLCAKCADAKGSR